MKRYENMSKEEIMEAYNSSYECATCVIGSCCPAVGDGCVGDIAFWLNQEIEMVPRISKINTIEELDKAYEEYVLYGSKPIVSYIPYISFVDWLKEKVEK